MSTIAIKQQPQEDVPPPRKRLPKCARKRNSKPLCPYKAKYLKMLRLAHIDPILGFDFYLSEMSGARRDFSKADKHKNKLMLAECREEYDNEQIRLAIEECMKQAYSDAWVKKVVEIK